MGDRELPESRDRFELLQVWLAEQADRAYRDAPKVQRRVWQVFDQLATGGGFVRAGDWEAFGFTFQQQMSSAITDLANVNLVVRGTDPENATRTVAAITPEGWLVWFHRNRYELLTGRDATDVNAPS